MTRLIVFFAVVSVTLTLLIVYVTRRASWAARLGDRKSRVAAGAMTAVVLSPFLMRATGLESPDVVKLVVAQVGFALGLTVLISAGLLLPFDLLGAIARRITRWRAKPDETKAAEPAAVETPPSPTITRREMLSRAYVAGAVGVGASTAIYGVAFGRRDYVVEQVPIPLRGLPRTLDGYTIVQLSDVHVGTFIGERELAAAIDLVRGARPDLVVMTGDLVDHDPRYADLLGRFARRLGELGARDGVVAIPGNHDYYAGIDDVLGSLRAAGTRVLRNDAITIGDRGGRFALLGVDDVWAPRNGFGRGADLPATIARAERDAPRVLLCHNPEFFPEAAPHVDLQLSGHTHGGQVNFVVRPADLVLPHGYIAGHYVRDGAQIYVNRGFGTAGPPARVGAPPEVSRIVLTSA
ncbi:metallophosphoesterase [Sandaracinus amylolyticus]|nr:metallophosphoesterase [Sandaracinus amylolyticus]